MRSWRGGPQPTEHYRTLSDVRVRLDSLQRHLAMLRNGRGGGRVFSLVNEPSMSRGQVADALGEEAKRLARLSVLVRREGQS